MQRGLTELTARRMWMVPDFVVWGLPDFDEIEYLSLEQVDSSKSLAFGSVSIGDVSQTVTFSGLTDVRGNALPAEIKRPLVTARSRNEDQVFIVGSETDSSFKIARDPASEKPVTVDLIIVELGE